MIDDDAPRSIQPFLQRASATAALGSLGMINAHAQATNDYKALVCVFLYGGNDWANTVVPYDQTSYDAYNNLRSNVAIPRNNLTATLLNPMRAMPLASGMWARASSGEAASVRRTTAKKRQPTACKIYFNPRPPCGGRR